MKKWFFSSMLVCSFSLTSAHSRPVVECLHDQGDDFFEARSAEPVEEEDFHLDSKSGHLVVKGMRLQGFSGESLIKLQAAFEVLEIVVNSEEFKERVINFKDNEGERIFASNEGLTNEEVYEKFMEGRETLQPNTPGEMNFYLKLYHRRWSRVIGYTSPGTNVININWKFFKSYTPDEVAGNLAHEWVHKLGFGHRSAKEHDSVPYAIGYIVEELATKHLTSPLRIAASR